MPKYIFVDSVAADLPKVLLPFMIENELKRRRFPDYGHRFSMRANPPLNNKVVFDLQEIEPFRLRVTQYSAQGSVLWRKCFDVSCCELDARYPYASIAIIIDRIIATIRNSFSLEPVFAFPFQIRLSDTERNHIIRDALESYCETAGSAAQQYHKLYFFLDRILSPRSYHIPGNVVGVASTEMMGQFYQHFQDRPESEKPWLSELGSRGLAELKALAHCEHPLLHTHEVKHLADKTQQLFEAKQHREFVSDLFDLMQRSLNAERRAQYWDLRRRQGWTDKEALWNYFRVQFRVDQERYALPNQETIAILCGRDKPAIYLQKIQKQLQRAMAEAKAERIVTFGRGLGQLSGEAIKKQVTALEQFLKEQRDREARIIAMSTSSALELALAEERKAITDCTDLEEDSQDRLLELYEKVQCLGFNPQVSIQAGEARVRAKTEEEAAIVAAAREAALKVTAEPAVPPPPPQFPAQYGYLVLAACFAFPEGVPTGVRYQREIEAIKRGEFYRTDEYDDENAIHKLKLMLIRKIIFEAVIVRLKKSLMSDDLPAELDQLEPEMVWMLAQFLSRLPEKVRATSDAGEETSGQSRWMQTGMAATLSTVLPNSEEIDRWRSNLQAVSEGQLPWDRHLSDLYALILSAGMRYVVEEKSPFKTFWTSPIDLLNKSALGSPLFVWSQDETGELRVCEGETYRGFSLTKLIHLSLQEGRRRKEASHGKLGRGAEEALLFAITEAVDKEGSPIIWNHTHDGIDLRAYGETKAGLEQLLTEVNRYECQQSQIYDTLLTVVAELATRYQQGTDSRVELVTEAFHYLVQWDEGGRRFIPVVDPDAVGGRNLLFDLNVLLASPVWMKQERFRQCYDECMQAVLAHSQCKEILHYNPAKKELSAPSLCVMKPPQYRNHFDPLAIEFYGRVMHPARGESKVLVPEAVDPSGPPARHRRYALQIQIWLTEMEQLEQTRTIEDEGGGSCCSFLSRPAPILSQTEKTRSLAAWRAFILQNAKLIDPAHLVSPAGQHVLEGGDSVSIGAHLRAVRADLFARESVALDLWAPMASMEMER